LVPVVVVILCHYIFIQISGLQSSYGWRRRADRSWGRLWRLDSGSKTTLSTGGDQRRLRAIVLSENHLKVSELILKIVPQKLKNKSWIEKWHKDGISWSQESKTPSVTKPEFHMDKEFQTPIVTKNRVSHKRGIAKTECHKERVPQSKSATRSQSKSVTNFTKLWFEW